MLRRFFASWPNHTLLRMPALSPTMKHGTIAAWNLHVGDRIEAGDVLMEIETDKATMEFECPEEGYLAAQLVKEGTREYPINAPIAVVVEQKEKVKEFESFTLADANQENKSPSEDRQKEEKEQRNGKEAMHSSSTANEQIEPKETMDSSTTAKEQPTPSQPIMASPAARKAAKERGIPLETLPKGQKITLSSLPTATLASSPFSDAPISSLRATIASKLTQAKQQIPHFYLTASVDMSQIMAFRKTNPTLNLSINDFVLKAASKALIKYPNVNTQVHDSFIRTFKNADICVAISTGPPENNLYAPVVKAVDQLSIEECSAKVKELVQRAREGKLTLQELDSSQGSFTVTNLGMFGVVEFFSPIINAPQSAILGVGAVKGGTEGSRMKVTLSCDHRAVDGALGAMWLKAFAGFMEQPLTML